jgi:hypothetical protein
MEPGHTETWTNSATVEGNGWISQITSTFTQTETGRTYSTWQLASTVSGRTGSTFWTESTYWRTVTAFYDMHEHREVTTVTDPAKVSRILERWSRTKEEHTPFLSGKFEPEGAPPIGLAGGMLEKWGAAQSRGSPTNRGYFGPKNAPKAAKGAGTIMAGYEMFKAGGKLAEKAAFYFWIDSDVIDSLRAATSEPTTLTTDFYWEEFEYWTEWLTVRWEIRIGGSSIDIGVADSFRCRHSDPVRNTGRSGRRQDR